MKDIQNESVLRVVKVGGSLFEDDRFAIRLGRWLDNSPNCRNVLIAGGGQPVNCIRDWYERFSMTDAYAHHASIRMMSETARLLTTLLHPVPIIDFVADIVPMFTVCKSVILDCQEFMKRQSVLERNWRTTSDSIAAEVAVHLAADELWLLKSTQPRTDKIDEWQQQELVDLNFARTAEPLRTVVIANFANDDLLSVKAN